MKPRRPVSRPLTLAARDRDRAQKLEALHNTLTEQIAALRTGDDWQRWLRVAAKFHTYSALNTFLIAAACPDATAVAGFEKWKTLGRQVDKGQRGIAILAPVLARPRAASDTAAPSADPTSVIAGATSTSGGRSDGATRGNPPDGRGRQGSELAGAGVEPADPKPRRPTSWRQTFVWDVSQTSGEPLPQRQLPQLLTGQAPAGLWDALALQVQALGFTLERAACVPASANGVTNYTTRTVTIRPDLDDAQAVKTLVHEAGHCLLHDPGTPAVRWSPVRRCSAAAGSKWRPSRSRT